MKKKLIRITTIPMALKYLLPGQMNFMQSNGFDVTMVSADSEERNDVIKNENCPHLIVPLTRKITPLQDLKCLFQLIKIFRKEKPDIVHSHTPKAGLLGMMAARFCGIKIRIHTVAGLPLMVEKGNRFLLLKFIEKLTYASATQVWPNSASIKDYIISHKLVPEKKVSVILNGSTNGINLDRFSRNVLKENILDEIKKSIGYSTDNIYILFIGRLVFDKGIVELVTAFNEMQNGNERIKLILAGDFENGLDPLPEAIINSIKTNESIIQVPWTQHVEYFMAISNLFVFPSHREGFPNVLLQAGAMKLPIICSRIAGNVDIVTNEKTGLLFEVNNSSEIKDAFHFAIHNMDKMELMAESLEKKVQQNFKREDVWNAILQKYLSILNPEKN
ncbi:MAG: glycosyltransferase family 4 protein [Ginsengibacter sp.]